MKNESKIDKKELKAACEALGLNYNEFIEEPKTLEKGIGEGTNFEALYYQQLEANQKLLAAIGSSNDKIAQNFQELQKGLSGLNSQLEQMSASPMHNRKSFDKIKVLEKSFTGEQQESARITYSLANQNKQVKNFLGDKMMEELQKGVKNGIYEKAAMQLDAIGSLDNSTISYILSNDKVLITA